MRISVPDGEVSPREPGCRPQSIHTHTKYADSPVGHGNHEVVCIGRLTRWVDWTSDLIFYALKIMRPEAVDPDFNWRRVQRASWGFPTAIIVGTATRPHIQDKAILDQRFTHRLRLAVRTQLS